MVQGNMTVCESPHGLEPSVMHSASHRSQRYVWAVGVAARNTHMPCLDFGHAFPSLVVSWRLPFHCESQLVEDT